MDLQLPLAMALLGLASGVHCVGMCGGVVTAFSSQKKHLVWNPRPEWQRQLFFNLGRISSYAAAGALAGIAGSAGALAAGMLPAQTAMLVIANVVLVLIGLQLAGRSRWLARLEALGAPLWRRIQPLAAKLLQARSFPLVYCAGLLWGLLPCGLVYGALVLAAAMSASAVDGAAAMLAFGIGTLPNLFAAGFAAARVRTWFKHPAVRAGAGAAVLAFGVYGLANAAGVAEGIRRGILCL